MNAPIVGVDRSTNDWSARKLKEDLEELFGPPVYVIVGATSLAVVEVPDAESA